MTDLLKSKFIHRLYLVSRLDVYRADSLKCMSQQLRDWRFCKKFIGKARKSAGTSRTFRYVAVTKDEAQRSI